MLLASVGALSVFIYERFIFEKPLLDNLEELKAFRRDAKVAAEDNSAYQINKLLVNLPTTTSRLRYLDVNIYLVPFMAEDVRLFEDHRAIIHDKVIDIAGRMTAEELGSISGKLLFESRIKREVNAFLGRSSVKKVYFTRFVIQ